MKVLKFGGTSVAHAENIMRVVSVVKEASEKEGAVLVVVSALAKVTDALIALAECAVRKEDTRAACDALRIKHEDVAKGLIEDAARLARVHAEIVAIFHELEETLMRLGAQSEDTALLRDAVLGTGERLSSFLISEALAAHGIPARHTDARTLIVTDAHFGCARVLEEETRMRTEKYFQDTRGVYVAGGFIGATKEGIPTTLGRGGSDYSAAILGAMAQASVVEIWTDVDGVFTADPRKVYSAFPLPYISYEEAAELSYFGAKVVHPKTMFFPERAHIPLLIKNTFNPRGAGTLIGERTQDDTARIVTGISSKSNVALLYIGVTGAGAATAIMGRVCAALAEAHVEVLLTTQASAEQSFTLAIEEAALPRAEEVIRSACAEALSLGTLTLGPITRAQSIIAIVGDRMKGVPGIAGKFFHTLGVRGINITALAQGSRERNLSAVVDGADETRALLATHEAFFGTEQKYTHVFLVGTGLIGSTLLGHMEDQKEKIRVCGIADVAHMYVAPEGIDLTSWKETVTEQGEDTDLTRFIETMVRAPLPNRVFVDCTASQAVADSYPEILRAHIAVVTPNKKANTSSLARFRELKTITEETGTPFFFETNVGAGLPVLGTLESLRESGDIITFVDMAISGTLNYIFGEYVRTDKTFSEIVAEAKQKGYTEPDPRDDLSGLDVARKLLIVARLIGLPLELGDIKITPVLPEEDMVAPDTETFLRTLSRVDARMAEKRLMAERQGKALVYLARLEHGTASVGLTQVAHTHPCAHLDGSSVTIAIHTKRYTTPMIIKGPGAGGEVTAGGVLADILRTRLYYTRI